MWSNTMQSASELYPHYPQLALVAIVNLVIRYACCGNSSIAAAALTQLETIAGDTRMSAGLRCAGNGDLVTH